MSADLINAIEAWKTNKTDPDTGKEVSLLRVFVDALKGDFTPSGLSKAFKITNFAVSTTAQKIPILPLEDRNSMVIYNKSSVKLFIGNSDVTSSGSNEGWELDAGSFFSLDITDAIEIYAIAASGTADVKIMELA